MKQNILSGYKGRVALRYHQTIYAKGLIGLSQSYNTPKWQLSGNYNFVSGNYVRKNDDVVTFDENKTRWESDMVRKTKAHEQHLYNFSAQYAADSLNVLQFGFDGNNNPGSEGNYVVPTQIFNTLNNELESYYLTSNRRHENATNGNAYALYDKKWGKNTLTWTNHFSTKHYRENQDVATQLHFSGQPEAFQRFATGNLQKTLLVASQLDYRLEKEKWNIESGLKFSSVRNKNRLDFFNGTATSLTPDPEKSNFFDYTERIYAAYLSSQYKWEKWELKAGLRSETTNIKSISDHPKVENNTAKTSFFPTFYVMYNVKEDQQLGFSYGKRIDRPNYDFLNPSKSYYNLYSYFQGDANLKSTIIHHLNITCTLNDWNFETYLRYTKDPSMEISVQNPQTFETIYHYTNIRSGKTFGANVSKSFTLTPKWKINTFLMGQYEASYFLGADDMMRKNQVFFYNGNFSSQITLDEAKTWDINLGDVNNSKAIQGSFDISSSQNLYLILNKKMLEKRLEATLVLNDIFRTDRNTISTRYANQNQYFKDYRDTQYCMFTLKYHFGNQKVKDVKASTKTDEQNRL